MAVSLFERMPKVCARGHPVGPYRVQISWKPCLCAPAQEAAGRGRGMGHLMVRCRVCEDEGLTTIYYEPEHVEGPGTRP